MEAPFDVVADESAATNPEVLTPSTMVEVVD